jgi:hypothetical protein
MLPCDARATLEFDVPKSIPQDVVLMVNVEGGKSFKDTEKISASAECESGKPGYKSG